MPTRQVGSRAIFFEGTVVPAAHGVGSIARLFFTRDGGSSSSCPQDRFAPAPDFYEGKWLQQLMPQDKWVPAPASYEGRLFQQPTAWAPAPNLYEGERFQQHTAWVPAPNLHEGQWFQQPAALIPALHSAVRERSFRPRHAWQGIPNRLRMQ